MSDNKKEVAVSELNIAEMTKALKTMTFSDADEITAEYLKLEVGEEKRMYFIDIKKISKINGKDGEQQDACRFLTEEGKFVINADAVVVSTCKDLPRLTPVCIQCTGTEKSSKGEYKTFSIFKLN